MLLPIWLIEVPKIAKFLMYVNNYLSIYFNSLVYSGDVIEIISCPNKHWLATIHLPLPGRTA